MQAPGSLDLSLWAGSSWDYTLTWQSGGTAVNLSGYTAALKMRSDKQDADVLVHLATGSGITLGGTAGTIALAMTAAQTAALGSALAYRDTTLVYDLELDGGSQVTRLVEGMVTVSAEVTR